MATQFEGWSDEELKAFALTGQMPQNRSFAQEAFKKPASQPAAPQPEDTTMGMSGPELFGAGAGYAANEVLQGVKELPQVLLRPNGPAGDKQLAQINADRAFRQGHGKKLMQNWEAQAGGLGMDMAASIAAPATLPAQMAMQGGLSALKAPSRTTGAINELVNRAVSGAESGAATGLIGVPMAGLGRLAGAASGKFSPHGAKALETDAAFRRLGGNATIRDLDPSSELAGFEGALLGRSRVVEDQARVFRNAAQELKDVPSATGRSYETRLLEGEKVRQGVVDATNNLKQAGTRMWQELDDHIGRNQIQPVLPRLSYTQADNILRKFTPQDKKGNYVFEKNPIFSRVAYYGEDEAKNLINMARAPAAAVQYGAPFSDLHGLQSAVGKALGRARKDANAPGAGEEAREAARELSKLYATLSQDVDNWMTAVAAKGDPELRKKAEMARDFWRDRVIPGSQGSLVQKSRKGTWRQDPRGYSEPTQMYSDLAGSKTQVSELLPFMNQEQQDLINSFMNMSDLQKVLKSGESHPAASGMGMLTNTAGMLIGSPLQLAKGIVSHAPVIHGGLSHPSLKKLYFAEDALKSSPAGKVAWAGAQYPQNEVESWERGLLGRE